MNKALLPLLALLLWSAASCNVYRRITGRRPAVTTIDSSLLTVRDSILSTVDTAIAATGTPAPVPSTARQTDTALLAALLPRWQLQMPWSTFSGKASVHYEGKGENRDFAATIRMERGKSVWVSVTALGLFEAARVLIRPDSIFVLDRIHREAHILPFAEAGSLLPIRSDFAALQSLIIGDPVRTGYQPDAARDTVDALIISASAPDFSQSMQFARGDTALHYQAISERGTFLLVESGSYRQADAAGRRFAEKRSLNITDKGEQQAISMEFSKADFDESVEIPFSVPEKYERR